ncbi:hypothetical protein [Haloplasma contractile]|uniref:Uncharacterized protein n=1 Tax=Haloplasma contractile SSD-17B TaxID=1033810 RepID=U2FL22_9MOLU|nr:hypothetical protein [Haloplasma contractile]ERJ11909.1 hypothetical protein HLPCO_002149 [Haloplasma contractile SSD-17B]
MENLRRRDHITEANVAGFIDKYFYSKIKHLKTINIITRVTDKEQQYKGIDLVVKNNEDYEFKIDEKVATNYTTKLNKFAFELDSFQSDRLVPGWLVTDNETDYYLLGWVEVVKDLMKDKYRLKTNEIISEEDILSLELIFVAKESIKEYLKKEGYDLEALIEMAKDIRDGEVLLEKKMYLYKDEYDKNDTDFHFTKSGSKVEVPVMINIRKDKLIELGNKRLFIVDKNGIRTKRL